MKVQPSGNFGQTHQSLSSADGDDEVKTKSTIRKSAVKRFVDNVSISGLLELYTASDRVILCLWIITLILSFTSIIYHSVLLIHDHLNQKPTFEIIQTEREVIPFPKVTVCAPAGTNKTWALENMKFPDREKALYEKMNEKEKEEFLEGVMSLMGVTFEYIIEKKIKPTSPNYEHYHHMLIETTDSWPNKTSHYPNALPTCSQTVSNCQVNGENVDCCKNVITQIDEKGGCYDLEIDKYYHSMDKTDRRTSMSPATFTFDLTMDWNHALDIANINGFLLHIGEPYSELSSNPVAIPAGSHAMVDVPQPLKRVDRTSCYKSKPPDTIFGPYDSRGNFCKLEHFFYRCLFTFFGCIFAMGEFLPIDSHACTGVSILPMKMSMAYGHETMHETNANNFISETMRKAHCLPMCEAWEYSPRPSYLDWVNADGSMPIGRKESGNMSKSRVTIYLGTSFYMERQESELKPVYDTFVKITFVAALYCGFSVITLAELLFYSIEMCVVYVKTRC